MPTSDRTTPIRREPPRFRPVEVDRTEPLSPHMVRVTVGGDELDGFQLDAPAASVRLLIPSPDDDGLALPDWKGNEFLRADGTRPIIRTLTPRRFDAERLELDLDIVIHDGGTASAWALDAEPGDSVAVSGPGRGHRIDDSASGYLLAGDESAIPAMSQLLEALPPTMPVDVHIEVTRREARQSVPEHPRATVTWHDLGDERLRGAAMLDALRGTAIADHAHVWVAGEAAGVHKIRNHLLDERGLPRSRATVRGYWKHDR